MAYIGQIKDRNGNVVYPKTVVGALADYTPMNISAPSTLGLAYLNASHDTWANATHYRTIELPDARLVALSVHVSSTQSIGASNNHSMAVLSVPSNIRPMNGVAENYSMYDSNGIWASGEITIDNGIVTVHVPQNVTTNANFGFHAEFLYLSLKN